MPFLLVFLLCSVALVAEPSTFRSWIRISCRTRGRPVTCGKWKCRPGVAIFLTAMVSLWRSVLRWIRSGSIRRIASVPEDIEPLADALGVDADEIERRLTQRSTREFVWLRSRLHPDVAAEIESLKLHGVFLQKEYRRFYPAGEVTSHVIGFTNIDDVGQEGLELAYNDWLQGKPGLKRVIRDRLGRTVEHVEMIRESVPGQI